jgi:hypothetical protein
MKIPVIKSLVESFDIEQLSLAEEDLLEGKAPAIGIEGEDEGEQLTHVFAARYILHAMQQGKEFKEALREFTGKVRSSLS